MPEISCYCDDGDDDDGDDDGDDDDADNDGETSHISQQVNRTHPR